jgi:phage terminase large subunit-like protein
LPASTSRRPRGRAAAWSRRRGSRVMEKTSGPINSTAYGFVHLPKEAAWLAEYLHELTAFPKGKHDDQVGSTAQTGASVTSRHSRQRHVW